MNKHALSVWDVVKCVIPLSEVIPTLHGPIKHSADRPFLLLLTTMSAQPWRGDSDHSDDEQKTNRKRSSRGEQYTMLYY